MTLAESHGPTRAPRVAEPWHPADSVSSTPRGSDGSTADQAAPDGHTSSTALQVFHACPVKHSRRPREPLRLPDARVVSFRVHVVGSATARAVHPPLALGLLPPAITTPTGPDAEPEEPRRILGLALDAALTARQPDARFRELPWPSPVAALDATIRPSAAFSSTVLVGPVVRALLGACHPRRAFRSWCSTSRTVTLSSRPMSRGRQPL